MNLGAFAFVHRFGSTLNTHVHLHVCGVGGCLRRYQMHSRSVLHGRLLR
ncbi:MAG: transposase [Burkholderiales bacterium]|nr:transposase [Burkholderiales bacterium]MBK6567523.1 transposase [Burkholderiales bacterium]